MQVFTVRGRLGRLGYLLGLLVWILALGAAVGGFVALIVPHGPSSSLTPEDTRAFALKSALFLILLVPPFAASQVSLTARRLRDAGLNPFYVMPGFVLLAAAAGFLTSKAPALSEADASSYPVLGGLVALGAVAFLLFWPSAPDRPSEEGSTPGRAPIAGGGGWRRF